MLRLLGQTGFAEMCHVTLSQVKAGPGSSLSLNLFIIFMHRISQHSQGPEGVLCGVTSLIFADDVELLASLTRDLQLLLQQFAAECVKWSFSCL